VVILLATRHQMLIARFQYHHFRLMPALDVLGLRDALRRDRFGVVQDFVLHFVLIQTIDQLFRYFHGDLR
jgi:hypothetical protein